MPLLLSRSLIYVLPISLIKYAPSLLFSDNSDMICSRISALLALIFFDLFDLIILLQPKIFSLIRSNQICSPCPILFFLFCLLLPYYPFYRRPPPTLSPYVEINHSTLPHNNGNLSLPYFFGNFPSVLLDNVSL